MRKQKHLPGRYDLTEGGIVKKLLQVALPVIGTQIIQMTYNLTDMFWLGRLNSDAVAASGTVGMYLWLSMAFMMFGRMGAEIGVSQNLGAGDRESARKYGENALTIGLVIGAAYALILMVLRGPLVGFFNLQEAPVVSMAQSYLLIVAIGVPFSFVTAASTGIFNGSGNSRIPFYINAVGLIINMVLDPVMIFTLGMGVEGAALATIIAQMVAGVLSVCALKLYRDRPFAVFRLMARLERDKLRRIFRWALPIAAESFLFTLLSMIVTRLIASYGSGAVAAQRISAQVESIGYLIAGGFSSALTAFIGQNYGGGKWSRIHRGVEVSTVLMSAYGLFVSLLLYFGARGLFSLFLPGEPEVIAIGRTLIRILAYFQIFGCLEGVAMGAFRGLGNTLPPSVISVSANLFRVILAYALSAQVGLVGIFWAVSIGMGVRGSLMFLTYLRKARSFPREDAAPSQ